MKVRNKVVAALLTTSMLASLCVSAVPVMAEGEKENPRVIITQDGEVDDLDSLIHVLLYANEMDIQGIVLTSSEWHWKGDETPEKSYDRGMVGILGIGDEALKQPVRWPGDEWMYELLEAYGEVYPNLVKHDANYPDAEYLKSVTKVGNVGYVGDTEEDTEGSNLIKDAILDDDERTLYLTAWGGTNTIVRALMTIEEENKDSENWEELKQKITNKIVISACGEQDQTYKEYIAEVWPDMKFINITGGPSYGYGWKRYATGETRERFESKWMRENLDAGHGALLDNYVTWGDGTPILGEEENQQFGTNTKILGNANNVSGSKVYQYEFISEGDSPTFFHLMDSGLRELENSAYGGYAGRYALDETKTNSQGVQLNYWVGQSDTDASGEKIPSGEQFLYDIQNEFAARADWCIDAPDSNHEPTIVITDDEGNDDIQELSVKAGDMIRLRAATSDPDGDYVSVNWWQYQEAGTYKGQLALTDADTEVVTFTVPADAAGTQIHLIARGQDDGNHPLSHYARVIINVAE